MTGRRQRQMCIRDRLIIACKNTNQYEEIKEVVSLFQWLLPGLATNVSYLWAQLNGLNLKRK